MNFQKRILICAFLSLLLILSCSGDRGVNPVTSDVNPIPAHPIPFEYDETGKNYDYSEALLAGPSCYCHDVDTTPKPPPVT